MAQHPQGFDERFRPLQPASRPKLILAFVLGPIAWLVALAVAAFVVDHTNAIGLGVIVAVASFTISVVVLSVLRFARQREVRRFVDRA